MKIKPYQEKYVFEYEDRFYKGNSIDAFLSQLLTVFHIYKETDEQGNVYWKCSYQVNDGAINLMPIGLTHYSVSKENGYTREEAIEDFKKLLFKRLKPVVYKRGKF